MSAHGPYHRLGTPGGPGCKVSPLPVATRLPTGETADATLLSADSSATELELLRTIAQSFGVQWGHDDLGWWAVIPSNTQAAADSSGGSA